jgi:hypothetical protein
MTATVSVSRRCNREIPGAARGSGEPTLKVQVRAVQAATVTLKRELLPSAAEQSAEVDRRRRLEQRRAKIEAEWRQGSAGLASEGRILDSAERRWSERNRSLRNRVGGA